MDLIEGGWSDAWKQINQGKLDYSWFSHKNNGVRLDYLFFFPKLLGFLIACEFSSYERENNFSDHSLLIAELEYGCFNR